MPGISPTPSSSETPALDASDALEPAASRPPRAMASSTDPRLPQPRSSVRDHSSPIPRGPRQVLPLSDLSGRKQAFLADGHPKTSQRISVETLGKVADGKNGKHQIEIQINGDGTALRQSQANWRVRNGVTPASPDDIYQAVKEISGNLEPIFQEHLTDQHKFTDALNANPALRGVFEEEMAQTVGLSSSEAVHDMTAVLVKAQQEKRAVGYVYTTLNPMEAKGVGKGFGHSDSYIMVSNGRVLNLVPYPTAACDEVRQQLIDKKIPFASADFSSLITPGRPVNMQADAAACGSLAVSQMKEYLKNHAQQLKEHSLVICGLKDMGVGVDFLLPSPEALRYSQAALPLKIANAMVRESGDRAQIEHDGQRYSVATLSGMMRIGTHFETAFGGKLEDLDAFRQRWCAAMDKAEDKRDALNFGAASGVQNGTLAQVSQRHAKLG